MTCDNEPQCKRYWYFAERTFTNGSKHISIQCGECLKLCRSPNYGNKAFISRHQLTEKQLDNLKEWV
jgi:hypothetical protein